ncbi:membrane protein YqaA, SNARE-associated domain [Alteromonadaceae bacterium Bs31]|nr:membrane protein YqaA, SNARE-associated domain [Alteromonadaceae bacterium Bs31]
MAFLLEFSYYGLFISAFLAATLLPLSSEVALSALILAGHSPTYLIATATAGNVLGSFVNYALGYWISMEATKRWLRMSEQELAAAKKRFEKYGLLALCFVWVPVIGDPLSVIAGALRVRLIWFSILVTAGKLARYLVVGYLAQLSM